MEAPSVLFTGVTSIQIGWSPLEGIDAGGNGVKIDHYDMEWDQGEGNWTTLFGKISSEVSSFNHKDLTPETTYQYRIKAHNKYGPADFYSQALTVTT